MRWALVAVLAGACSLEHGVEGHVAGDGGADAPVDGTTPKLDAPGMLCHVAATNKQGTDRGRVGGSGGSTNFPPLACPNVGDQVVGVALLMSNQNTLYGERSAQGIRIACAPVTVTQTGGTTGTITTYEVVGDGGFGWAPSTWTAITQCKPGWIVSGMSAHTTNGGDLFLDATIRCSQITATGGIGATETIYVAGSLTESAGLDTETCGAGEMLVRLTERTGAGLDSVNLYCTTPTCN